MSDLRALEGAPLCARQLHVLLTALPPELRTMPPTARAVPAAMGELVAAHPFAVMPSRSDTRHGYAWLRARGLAQ